MHPFELFFTERYAAAYAEERRAEDARRAEAFLEVAPAVAGIPLRALTAEDLFILDGYESPFVRGNAAAATRPHIVAVLWLLRRDRVTCGGWRERLAYWLHERQLARRWHSAEALLQDHAELNLWFAAVFADVLGGGGGDGGRPVAHFLGELLAPLAAKMGAFDPASGRPLIKAPMARLFQYAAVLRESRGGPHILFHASDRLRGEALAAWNEMRPEQKADWETRAAAA